MRGIFGDLDRQHRAEDFLLHKLLVQHAGKVLTHQFILRQVWGPAHESDVQYLRVFARQLRQKIESDPAQPQLLLTEPGVGYRFTD
ncbi:MAG: helix-turn-helix domain-containing protein [Ferrovibrio sp.]